MSGVTLSSAIRSTLLSLQNTAAQSGLTQTRLATGKRVNTALDNPSSYFTAQALGARASDLNALVDNITQAQQTVQAVNQSIGALSKLIQAAQALAHQARVSPPALVSYAEIDQAGSTNISGEVIGSVIGNVDVSGGFAADVEGLQIQVGGSTFTVHNPSSPGTSGISTIVNRINSTAGLSSAVTASVDPTGHYLQLVAKSSDTSFQVLSSAAASALGVANQSGNSANLLDVAPGLAGTRLTVGSEGGQRTVTFGSSGAQVSTLKELQSGLSGTGVTVSVDTGGGIVLSVAASLGVPNSLTTSGTALAAFGLPSAQTEYGAVGATNPDPSRVSYQAQYNNLLRQIDTLAQDSSYNGINLLRGGNLQTAFNENGTSSLAIAGVSFDAQGLGLSQLVADDFQSDTVVDSVLGKLDAALTALRTQASRFGSSFSVLQTRQDFTRTLIDALQAGASDLTLADSNLEGANLLALRTRQELSTTALSLAADADHAVLRLFL